jgi:hypothetical protein
MSPLSLANFEFKRIALTELPVRAQLMRRVDRKYRIGTEHLDALFRLIAPHYSLIQAGEQDAAFYLNRYWDGIDRPFFHAHRVRKPRRCKFRQRTYTADGMSFWELKERLATGYTRKTRLEVEPFIHDEGAKNALNRLWTRVGIDPPDELQPALDIQYKRLSFVHNNGHERLTFDYELCLSKPLTAGGVNPIPTSDISTPIAEPADVPQTWLCSRDLCILELKQDRPGPSVLDLIRRSRSLQAISFSKYYIGSLLWQEYEKNHQAVSAIPSQLGYGRTWTISPLKNPL